MRSENPRVRDVAEQRSCVPLAEVETATIADAGANVVDEEIERTEDEVILERDMLDGIVEMQPRIAAATLGLSGIPF